MDFSKIDTYIDSMRRPTQVHPWWLGGHALFVDVPIWNSKKTMLLSVFISVEIYEYVTSHPLCWKGHFMISEPKTNNNNNNADNKIHNNNHNNNDNHDSNNKNAVIICNNTIAVQNPNSRVMSHPSPAALGPPGGPSSRESSTAHPQRGASCRWRAVGLDQVLGGWHRTSADPPAKRLSCFSGKLSRTQTLDHLCYLLRVSTNFVVVDCGQWQFCLLESTIHICTLMCPSPAKAGVQLQGVATGAAWDWKNGKQGLEDSLNFLLN